MNKSKLVVLVSALFVLMVVLGFYGAPTSLAKDRKNKINKIDPALLRAMQADPKGKFPVFVQTAFAPTKTILPSIQTDQSGQVLAQLNTKRSQALVDRLKALKGHGIKALAMLGAGSGTLKKSAILKLSRAPMVSYIQLDQALKPLGNPGDALSLYTDIVHAPQVWAQGYTGQGIGVAILDSGVIAADDLGIPTDRIVASVDLVDENAAPDIDPGGHGSHVAGIVAGNGTDSAGARKGVAPGANIINVRVINSSGSTSMSTVIAGLAWVVNHRNQYNIRVVNLSLGATATQNYRTDPLAAAVEMVWHSGIVVVAAAGNSGPLPGSIVTPGHDPYIVTVGAVDDNGTLSTLDDTIPAWSAVGPTLDNRHKPDLVAPGRKVVSLRSPGSFLDNLLPDRVTDTYYFRLSGTSMSSPVVAGTAALMLQRNANLKPDQVKKILTQTATGIAGATVDMAGSGMVDAYAAVNSNITQKANGGKTPADDFCKSVYSLLYGMPLQGIWRDPNKNGINWNNITWDNITWNRATWDNITWENITWDNITWNNITWDNITWNAMYWDALEDPLYNESGTWETIGDLD